MLQLQGCLTLIIYYLLMIIGWKLLEIIYISIVLCDISLKSRQCLPLIIFLSVQSLIVIKLTDHIRSLRYILNVNLYF